MSTVFISHSNQDNQLIQPIVERLRGAGLRPWIDYENIRGGADWLCEIEAGIARCDAVLVILTAASAASVWVERECLYAFQLQKPLLTALTADLLIPLHLINLQYCDLRQAQGMDKLLDSLDGLLAAEKSALYADETPSSAPQAANFFPYLAQLPHGQAVELVARELYALALDVADAVEFGGRRRPGFHARLHLAGGRQTVFSVWAYPRQPGIQLPWRQWSRSPHVDCARIRRELRSLLPTWSARQGAIPLRLLESAVAMEGFKLVMQGAAIKLRSGQSLARQTERFV